MGKKIDADKVYEMLVKYRNESKKINDRLSIADITRNLQIESYKNENIEMWRLLSKANF